MKTQFYAIWVEGCISCEENKWLGMMKRWQAYYLAFHLWVVMRLAGNKKRITIMKEDYA